MPLYYSPRLVVSSKTGSYTLLPSDNFVNWDTSGGTGTATIPTAVGNTGVVFQIGLKTAGNLLTLNTTSSQTIGGLASGVIKIGVANDNITIISDGTNWQIIEWGITFAARYTSCTSTVSTTANSPSTATFTTLDYDPFSAYSSGTLTIPFPGKYQINAGILISASFIVNQSANLFIVKGGTNISEATCEAASTTVATLGALLGDTINCATGDAITIGISSTGTTPAVSNANIYRNFFSIVRVGN